MHDAEVPVVTTASPTASHDVEMYGSTRCVHLLSIAPSVSALGQL